MWRLKALERLLEILNDLADWLGLRAHTLLVRFQFAGRRISITLETANQTEAAVRAKERFLFLVSNGWKAFLKKYKPENRTPALIKRPNIIVGEFIAAATAESHLPLATINPWARAFRGIVADVARIRAAKKRFDYRTGGNQRKPNGRSAGKQGESCRIQKVNGALRGFPAFLFPE